MSTALRGARPGRWRSPITPSTLAGQTLNLTETGVDRESGALYWGEGRPSEGGRVVLRAKEGAGDGRELLGAPWNVRSRVNEYGGGAFAVGRGQVVFSDLKTSRVYLLEGQKEPRAISPDRPEMRYASFALTPHGALAVSEDHTEDDPAKVVNAITHLDFAQRPKVVVSGADFYSTPCVNPSATSLAWLEWSHPNMSWDGTELYIADWHDASRTVSAAKKIKGRPGEESCLQPVWLDDHRLLFLSDETGYYQIYLHDLQLGTTRPLLAQATASEFGITEWIYNQPTFTFLVHHGREKIFAIETRAAFDRLVEIDMETGTLTPIDSPYVSMASLRASGPGRLCFFGVTESEYKALVEYDLDEGKFSVIQKSSDLTLDPGYCSKALPLEFPTDQARSAHALLYLPRSKDYELGKEKAPLIVSAHGGPTSHARPGLSSKIAYWTSRGFAYLDVNYGGSSGYGKAYRNRLNGEMGIVDVDDTLNGAHYLQNEGSEKYRIDGKRIAITGSSAGGYVVLSALTAERQGIFAVGTSYYGISSLLGLLEDTHKFESRYLDRLVGSRGQTEEEKQVYRDRSPLTHAARLKAPLLLLQGKEDKIVPPNQAEKMIREVDGRTRIDFHLFPGEGHGFRGQETIEKAITYETSFYADVMAL